MMEKMLTFEEWKGRSESLFTSIFMNDVVATDLWQSARQGLIPADRAIEVPETWPDWAKGAVLVFTDETMDTCQDWPENEGYAGYVPRPTPQWSPKIGEAVFVHFNPTRVGIIEKIKEGNAPFVIKIDGKLEEIHTVPMLKPFRPEAIGLSWGEI